MEMQEIAKEVEQGETDEGASELMVEVRTEGLKYFIHYIRIYVYVYSAVKKVFSLLLVSRLAVFLLLRKTSQPNLEEVIDQSWMICD